MAGEGRERLALAGILLLALLLRIPALDAGLWYDEIDTLVRYVRLPWGMLVTTYDSLNNHLLFSLEAKLAVSLFGETAWALRLPAMLLGVASIWALWRLAREILGPAEALLAALLMAVSYHHVWFSQNARGYTGLLFLGLLACLFLLRGMRTGRTGPWLGFGLCLALSMYTHLSAAFLFLALGIAWAVLTLPRLAAGGVWAGLRGPLAGAGTGIALTLALYAPILPQMTGTFSEVRAGPEDAVAAASIAEWKNPLWTLAEVAAGLGGFGPATLVALAGVLVAILLGLVGLARRAPVLALAVPLHVGLTILLLVLLSFRVWPRYFFVDLGFVCLLLVHGAMQAGVLLARLPGWPGRVTAATAGRGLALLGIVASLVLLPENYRHPKQDFAGARDYVEGERAADAVVIALGLTAMPFRAYYAPHWAAAETVEEIRALLRPGQETWIVYAFPEVSRVRHADILALLGADFREVADFPGTLGDGGIVVLRGIAS